MTGWPSSGAEVIKTEMPGRGDDLRRLGPTEDGCTYWFAVDNRNKKLMTLDLHLPKGQDIVRRLVSHCDVVLENFRPGVLERWGLGWEALHAINPTMPPNIERVADLSWSACDKYLLMSDENLMSVLDRAEEKARAAAEAEAKAKAESLSDGGEENFPFA